MADYISRLSSRADAPYTFDVTVRDHHFTSGRATDDGVSAGPGPFELVASGLGACTGINITSYAKREGLPLEGFDIEVRFHNAGDKEHPRWQAVERIALHGPLDADQREAIMTSAEQCAVRRMILSELTEIHESLVESVESLAEPAAV